ncbi:MAG: TonB-dependent receptor [Edaphobacter sp.]|uniref:TonB-dependent receptor domain-containing protein n=1 Tax=Edaphobacter sp. TaxID=1934404 RepID=UPI002387E9C5|nr:TonB-dependent receptor [Edaphobacter sp.]MDE1175739.1 TonB-dependent receptor [Edaphobacter sp.]
MYLQKMQTLSRRFAIVISLLLLGHFAQAQVANSTITGRITDNTGAIIPGGQVTLTKSDTGLVQKSVTNQDGIYNFPSLQTGPYRVQVTQAGFKTATTEITLTVNQNVSVDLSLEVGSSTETIDVQSAGMADLEVNDATISYTVGARQVSDLPLNGRNPYGLAALSPGINPGGSFGAGVATVRGAVVAAATNNFESNGGASGSNEVLLDGVPITVCCQGQPALTPSVEVVDQFKVITSVPSSQFGRSSGGILNIVTKSGANNFHGTAYEYFRNDKLDAANYFTKRTGIYPIPGRDDFRLPHRYNQYGVFVNGPVWLPKIYDGRNKTFFTFGWEATRNTSNAFTTATVPTTLMRQGVFTEALNPIYDPYSTVGSTRQLLAPACVAGTCYAAGRAIANPNSTALKLLQFYPLPNASGTANNYSYANTYIDKEDQFNFRVDHNFSAAQRVFARGTRDVNTHHENDIFNQPTGPSGINQELHGYLFAVGDSWTLSPNFLVQTAYGFSYQKNFQIPQNYTGYTASDYGYSGNLDNQQQLTGLPFVSINGYANMSYAANTNRWEHYTHSLASTAVWQRGKQTLTFGYDGRLILEHQQSASNGPGTLTFDTTLTNGPTVSGAVPSGQSQFDAFAAYMLGTFTSASLTRQVKPAYDQWYNAMYFQDDWKINPRLTLNLGLRYEIETGMKERHNQWADIDLNVANPLSSSTLPFTGGARYLGSDFPTRTWKTSYNKFAPRFGLAFQADDKTVLRGAYGILYLPTSQRFYLSSTLGSSQTTQTIFASTNVPTTTMTNPFPNGVLLPAGSAAGVTVGTGTSVAGVQYDTPMSYSQQWNVSVERQIANGIVLHLNYVGSHGVHLPINFRPNDLRDQYWGAPGSAAQIAYLQAAVPNPFYGKVTTGPLAATTVQRAQLLAAFPQYVSNTAMNNSSLTVNQDGIGASMFHGAQAFITIQRSKNLSATLSYTFSKLMGNTSPLLTGFLNANGTPDIQNSYHIRDHEWSVLTSDVPQRFVANANYSLPFGRGQRFGGGVNGFVNQLIGSWKLNTIISIQSGFPLGITQTGGQAFSGSRPTFVQGATPLTSGDVRKRLGGTGQMQAYLNPAAFRLSQAFELGDVPRSSGRLRGPTGFQDDLSVIKDFPIHETLAMQFRLEAFNVLNKVQFGLPNTQFGSSTFGAITAQANLPRNVQAALKLTF